MTEVHLTRWLWQCVVKVFPFMVRTLPQGYHASGMAYRPLDVDADGHLQVDVLSGGGSPTISEAAYATGSVTAADLDSNGTTWEPLVSANPAKDIAIVEVFNNTDGSLEVSFDGGTTVHARIPPFGSISRDLASAGLKETTGASSGVDVREWASDPVVSTSEGHAIANASWAA